MADGDWLRLGKIARSFQASGIKTTAGQVAAQLLRDAIARLPALSRPYPVEHRAKMARVADPLRPSLRAHSGAATVLLRNTTYLVGAGINRDLFGPEQRSLPLGSEFFRYVLEQARFASDHARTQLAPLWAFIDRYWHLSESALKRGELDVEECLSFVELQRREALAAGDAARLRAASHLEFLLGGLLAECYAQVDHWHFFASEYQRLGRRMFDERAAVITFNYDTLLETAIQHASPPAAGTSSVLRGRYADRRIADDAHVTRSWDPLLAYKAHFDELVVRSGSASPVRGEPFYRPLAPREAAHPPFLKLHGSVDWYFHTGYTLHGKPVDVPASHPGSRSRFQRAHAHFDAPLVSPDNAEMLLPLMTTSALEKPADGHPILLAIWNEARIALERTKTLVVIGYSFPAADFHLRRLLRQAFAENTLDHLCIVNPDAGVASLARDLCNFRKPISVYRDIAEYLNGP